MQVGEPAREEAALMKRLFMPSVSKTETAYDLQLREHRMYGEPVVKVPIGAIVAYAGPIDREEFEAANRGWMLCDGRQLNRNNAAFTDLFNVIGFAWGGDGAARFNLPDLQGLFLRGVDERQHGESRDPDNNRRTAIRPGGAVGASVGSARSYATAEPSDDQYHNHSGGGGDQETRPINAYVHWIIRVQ